MTQNALCCHRWLWVFALNLPSKEKEFCVTSLTKESHRPPAQLLVEALKTQGLSQTDLALILGRTPQYVNELVKGKKIFDATVALELEDALGISATIWLMAQLEVQRQLAPNTNTRKAVFQKYSYLADAVRLGWIEDDSDLSALTHRAAAFDQARLNMGRVDNKQSLKLRSLDPNVSAWNYQVFRQAMSLQHVPTYDENHFKALLIELQNLMAQEDGVTKVQATLLRYGVRLVFVPHIRQCPVDGVASFNNGQPYIGVSLRIARFDHFWFVVMHELAHIYYKHHDLEPDNVEQRGMENAVEAQANQTARDWMLSEEAYKDFVRRFRFTLPAIESFATAMNVHPSVVIGRLKIDGFVPWNKHARAHPSVRDHLQ
jgi:HTH-type transcriptional regulator / antitoxin HigA